MVEKEPSRETAYGAFCAFDDRNEGYLSVNEVNGIFCALGEPLKPDEVNALMCEINYLGDAGRVNVEQLIDFLYSKEPIHIKGNDEALGVGQITSGGKLK
ncbi:hypothetical protein DIPPA_01069 [Diplonema papillatum]|nr:hypothetical protein DIPPA_01069 [Diplonema papillatum]